MVIQAMPPLTRCAFALTCKHFAAIACNNECLELEYDERSKLTGQPEFCRQLICSYTGSIDDCYYERHIIAREEIERMGGMYTQGIGKPCEQW